MTEIQRIKTNSRASQVVITNQYLETAGLVAECLDQDIQAQTQCVLQQLDALLLAAGSSKNHVIKIQIWLANMDDFSMMNQVYDTWVSEIEKPARACVGAQLANPKYLIEIQASAFVKSMI